jgi:hypothetical protein
LQKTVTDIVMPLQPAVPMWISQVPVASAQLVPQLQPDRLPPVQQPLMQLASQRVGAVPKGHAKSKRSLQLAPTQPLEHPQAADVPPVNSEQPDATHPFHWPTPLHDCV